MASSSLVLANFRKTAAGSSYLTRSNILLRRSSSSYTTTSLGTYSKLFTFISQSPSSVRNFHTNSSIQYGRRTSKILLTRSMLPYLRSPAACGGSSIMSRFIKTKDFQVHVSRDDQSDPVNVMKRLRNAINPRVWPYLKFTIHKDHSPHVAVGHKRILVLGEEDTDEGYRYKIQMDKGAKWQNLKVFVKDNTLICEGFGTDGETLYVDIDLPEQIFHLTEGYPVGKETLYVKFDLPKKTYQVSDVKAKLEGGMLYVTFSNLTPEDFDETGSYILGSGNENEK